MFEYLLSVIVGIIPFLLYMAFVKHTKTQPVPVSGEIRENVPVKGVLLVRNDLNMGKGKIVAQAMHAAYSAANKKSLLSSAWKHCGFKKVSLKVETEQEMDTLVEKAHSKGIPCSPVIDAGRTQVEPNTHTVTFIGPWYEDELNEITGHLRLL
ncbi:peptidyl-tRNA hydrolase, PTH2 family [Nematocida major]|uniref:peptidyl-tRNA hydrolase, PTH2 family n=1 Tax=Nematocida major TaxID=1912982 RepID=UPI0020074C2F|nr:peptidyl-tRNA hydrolase, PTH2 family [Nematocida major]KAH9387414.1 peptidyl-tRNA hydrolase, PTH2 family [Nematocida major]